MNKVNLSRFSTQNLFQIRACVISARKAKHLDVTTMFTYSHANTPLGLSERAHYLSYFIKRNIEFFTLVTDKNYQRLIFLTHKILPYTSIIVGKRGNG